MSGYMAETSTRTSSRNNNIGSSSSSSSRYSSSSSPSSSSSSPILNMAQDQLFTILLLLPVESILSFAMTCKRLYSLTSSNTLWESICRREWGTTSVDTLKLSASSSAAAAANTNQQQQQLMPWMRIYKQVAELDSVSLHELPNPDGVAELTSPRASHSLNFVSDCLVLFGGGCEGGRHLDDTWVAYVGNNFRRTPKWNKVQAGIPSGRFGHTCVVIGDLLVLFGGINDRGVRLNDTWVGQVIFDENVGITLSWRFLDVGSVLPPPRGAHAACCVNKTKMVIHGGIGLYGLRLGDTWVLEVSENLLVGSWWELVSHPSPPPRSGHSLTCIETTGVVLFGGRGLGYEVMNDVWTLQTSQAELGWTQVLYELQDVPQGLSLPRVGHSATVILGGRLLIYGGEDSSRHRKDDFWLLDINALTKGSRAIMWKRLKARGYRPNCRSFHRACMDRTGRYLFVFGGMVDGVLQPSEAAGLRFDGELFLVDLFG